MALKTGLTDRTIKNLQLNAGVLLSSYTKSGEIDEENIIGATRGGGSFNAVPEIHQASVDGAPTYTKGLERCDGWNVNLSFTMVEFTAPAIIRALGVGASSRVVETTDTKITAVTNILTTDYKDVYWVGDTSDGKNVVILVKNAMNTSGLALTVTDKGEGTFGLTLQGHHDTANLDAAPFEIILEGVGAGA